MNEESAPVTVHPQNGQPMPEKVEVIYFAACHQVAAELWPNWSLNQQGERLRPKIDVTVGADRDFIDLNPLTAEAKISLKKWKPDLFALGVVIAAHAAATDRDTKQMMARAAVQTANATIDIQDLKKERH